MRRALFSALGLVPLGCGGISSSSTPERGSTGGMSSTTSTGAAGSSSAGANTSSAGMSSAGMSSAGMNSAGMNSAGMNSAGMNSAGMASAGGASGGSGSRFPCETSVPVGEGTGYERCAETSVLHRPAIGECPPPAPDADPIPGQPVCLKDADCGPDRICVCDEWQTYCAEAKCSVDADCGPGFLCRGYDSTVCGFGPESFACQTAADVCNTHLDCQEMRCGADSGSFKCDVPLPNPACGRPFLVMGEARMASLEERPDWADSLLSPASFELEFELRQRVAAAWARIARMEHASIAAFARFTLQLLQLGAPAELVERSARAMQDEIRHARLAFAVVTRCAGAAVGPGLLDVESSLGGGSLAEVVRVVWREGCVGETRAALEAREASEHVADAALRAELTRVAEDEAAHAELAWRFLRWALEQQPAVVGAMLREELAASIMPEAPLSAASVEEQALTPFGILPEATRQQLHRAALCEVIEPCAHALLDAIPRARSTHSLHPALHPARRE